MSKLLNEIFPNLKHGNDNIYYYNNNSVETKFSDEAQNGLFLIEDTSWWFKYRAEVIKRIFNMFFEADKLCFDVGGGNGYTTRSLEQQGVNIALLEPTYAACKNALNRGLKTAICGSLTDKDINDGQIEHVLLLDVLEHIEDDVEFLRLIHKKLCSDGKILITVPAMKSLWSSEDDQAGHFRRYYKKSLLEVAEKSGFTVKYINYFFEFGYMPILIFRVWLEKLGIVKTVKNRTAEERKKISDNQFKERKGIVSAVLNFFERIEQKRLLGCKKVRFGSSLICVLEKADAAQAVVEYNTKGL